MGRLAFEDFTDNRKSLKTLFFIKGNLVAEMLHHAHDVRVTCVLVLPVEEPFSESLVVSYDVALVHPNLDMAIYVGGQVRQRRKRLV